MTDNDSTTLFQSLGVNDTEQALYLALLSGGPSSIRQLAATTKINRGKTYESLKRLVALGLVSFKRKGEQRRFVAEGPERLQDLITEKKEEVAQLEETAKTFIPGLLALGKRRGGEPVVRFYEDNEGVVAILRDVLNTLAKQDTKEYLAYSSRPLRQYLYRQFPSFTRRRIKEKISVKVIAIGQGGDPAEYASRKWLLEPVDEHLSSYVLIYADKIAMISLSANDTPYGVVIEEPGVAATQRLLFEKLWQSLPESTPQI